MENIRIQDDLYTAVNQAKLDELVIPDDMPVPGGRRPGIYPSRRALRHPDSENRIYRIKIATLRES